MVAYELVAFTLVAAGYVAVEWLVYAAYFVPGDGKLLVCEAAVGLIWLVAYDLLLGCRYCGGILVGIDERFGDGGDGAGAV